MIDSFSTTGRMAFVAGVANAAAGALPVVVGGPMPSGVPMIIGGNEAG